VLLSPRAVVAVEREGRASRRTGDEVVAVWAHLCDETHFQQADAQTVEAVDPCIRGQAFGNVVVDKALYCMRRSFCRGHRADVGSPGVYELVLQQTPHPGLFQMPLEEVRWVLRVHQWQ